MFDRYPVLSTFNVIRPQQWLTIAASLDAEPEEERNRDLANMMNDSNVVARLAGLPLMPAKEEPTPEEEAQQKLAKEVGLLRGAIRSLNKRLEPADYVQTHIGVWPQSLVHSDVAFTGSLIRRLTELRDQLTTMTGGQAA